LSESFYEKQSKILAEILPAKSDRKIVIAVVKQMFNEISRTELDDELRKYPSEQVNRVLQMWLASINRALIEIVTNLEVD